MSQLIVFLILITSMLDYEWVHSFFYKNLFYKNVEPKF